MFIPFIKPDIIMMFMFFRKAFHAFKQKRYEKFSTISSMAWENINARKKQPTEIMELNNMKCFPNLLFCAHNIYEFSGSAWWKMKFSRFQKSDFLCIVYVKKLLVVGLFQKYFRRDELKHVLNKYWHWLLCFSF